MRTSDRRGSYPSRLWQGYRIMKEVAPVARMSRRSRECAAGGDIRGAVPDVAALIRATGFLSGENIAGRSVSVTSPRARGEVGVRARNARTPGEGASPHGRSQ
jgi:hypothetical protein